MCFGKRRAGEGTGDAGEERGESRFEMHSPVLERDTRDGGALHAAGGRNAVHAYLRAAASSLSTRKGRVASSVLKAKEERVFCRRAANEGWSLTTGLVGISRVRTTRLRAAGDSRRRGCEQ